MSIQSYKDLIVWQKSMDLAVQVYALTKEFPADERFRMVDQLARAAASVPANIAEGQGRESKREFARFLSISKGSLLEVETFLLLAIRLKFVTEQQTQTCLSLAVEVGKMLTALKKKLVPTEK